MNTFFKSSFLLVAVCLVLVLFGIYQKMENGRFRVLTSAEGATRIVDVNSGQIYFFGGYQGWFVYGKDSQRIFVKPPF